MRDGEYSKREKSEHFSNKYAHFDDDLPIDEYFIFHKGVMEELLRVSKIVIYNIGIVTGSKESVFKMIGEFHKNIRDIIIWDKGHGEPAMHSKIINRRTELVLILESEKRPGRMIDNAYFDRGTIEDVWKIKRPRSTEDHKAVMPELLAGKSIICFSKKGGIIYDPFGGIGTTAKMALKYDRNFITSEISKEYCKKIESNLEPLLIQKRLF